MIEKICTYTYICDYCGKKEGEQLNLPKKWGEVAVNGYKFQFCKEQCYSDWSASQESNYNPFKV